MLRRNISIVLPVHNRFQIISFSSRGNGANSSITNRERKGNERKGNDRSDVSVSDNEEMPTSAPTLSAQPAVPEQREVVTKWTVKNPGKTPIPTTNDYTRWTIDQLRMECSSRKKKIKRNIVGEKDTRVSCLQENDNDRELAIAAVDPVAWRLCKTDHTTIRLLNVLFSDQFVDRLTKSEDAATRAQLDTREVAGNSPFWKDVR